MMTASQREPIELWQRAHESLQAMGTLLSAGFPDFAASRAYYAAFYAVPALLLAEGKEFRSHRGTLALIHRGHVKTGALALEIGRIFNTLSAMRSVGDYGGATHVSHVEASTALNKAQQFLEAIWGLLAADIATAPLYHPAQ